MTSEDVRSVTFEQTRKGYRTEDVDDFLQQVANEMERIETDRNRAVSERDQAFAQREPLAAELRNALAAKEDAEAKLYVLAAKVEEYRGQEETLKTALINAQRMGETVVHEAKQKAEQMLRDATGSSELLRQKAEQDAVKERATLEGLVAEVNRFKTTILNLYKQHIESLSALDPPVAKAEEALSRDDEAQAGKQKQAPTDVPPLGNAEPALPPVTPPTPLAPPVEAKPQAEADVGRTRIFDPEKKPRMLFGGELLDD